MIVVWSQHIDHVKYLQSGKTRYLDAADSLGGAGIDPANSRDTSSTASRAVSFENENHAKLDADADADAIARGATQKNGRFASLFNSPVWLEDSRFVCRLSENEARRNMRTRKHKGEQQQGPL